MFSVAIIQYGFRQSKSNYSLFTKGTGSTFLALLVYVDDVIISRPNETVINLCKEFLNDQFKLKDLGPLKYFLGLEVAHSKKGINQRHTLPLLEDVGYVGIPGHPSRIYDFICNGSKK